MNRRKGMYFTLLLVIVFVICMGCGAQDTAPKKMLTLEEVVETFEKEGISLDKASSKSPGVDKLKGVQPAVYFMGKTPERLLIYIFKYPDDTEEYQFGMNLFQFVGKNALIVYKPSKDPESLDEWKNIITTRKTISDIVFKKINEGKRVVFKGQSKHWEATVTLKYYNNTWEDENGISHFSGEHWQSYQIHYKLPGARNVGEVSYEFEGNGHRSTGTFTLENNGYSNLAGTGSNGFLWEPEKEIYHVRIKWNGKEEQLELKAQPLTSSIITIR